jgi:hypothetical protein
MAVRVHGNVPIIAIFALSLVFICTLGPGKAASVPSAPRSAKLSIFRPSGVRHQPKFSEVVTGKILHTADGGQIFGFDVNQNGNDGFLGSAQTISSQGQVLASLETFNQTAMTITKTVITTNTMDDWVAEGISSHDVGLVLHDHVVNNRDLRGFRILNPVASNAFTGHWTPPVSNLILHQVAENQSTPTNAVLAEDTSGNLLLFSSNIAANTFGPVLHLDPSIFQFAQLAQDTVTNEAILATSPDGGAVGGEVPLLAKVNLSTGAAKKFNGIRIGIFHSGFVNGLAVDSATGIACTTTELDAAVEFYDLTTDTGVFVAPLPGSDGNQGFSGSAVVNDPIHRLFLVVQGSASIGPPGSAVVVFDEQGNFVEAVTGFLGFSVAPGLAINPSTRTGFIQGPTPDALTQFTY